MHDKTNALIWAFYTRQKWLNEYRMYVILNTLLFVILSLFTIQESYWIQVLFLIYLIVYMITLEVEGIGVVNSDIINEPEKIQEFVFFDVVKYQKWAQYQRKFSYAIVILFAVEVLV